MATAKSNPLVVVVAYNNTQDLRSALDSLGPGHALVVVDNGMDDQVQALVASYGGRYLTPGRNVGFAAAVNLALDHRGDRDVLLLNPDARVTLDLPRSLRAVMEEDPRIGMVAPRLRHPSGAYQQVTWPIPSPRESWIDTLGLRRLLPARRVFLVGAVLLLRAEALADVGLFDERYFLYAEECDWQRRALDRGWRSKLADHLVAEHVGSGSSDVNSVRERHFHRSAELFGLKWHGRAGWASMRAASVVGAALRVAANVARPRQRSRYVHLLRLYVRGSRGGVVGPGASD